MNRAYSLLTIKAVDEEQRIIEGVATTPSTDRDGDIVDPMGAEFTLPIPLCWQHESQDSAIGEVFEAKATKNGISFKARVAFDDVPGLLKDRLDYAWRSIKLKLVRGVSVGFSPTESVPIDGTWGLLFKRWQWLELSPVTIPANAEATIQNVKAFGAASGARRIPPGVSGPVKMLTTPKSGDPMLTIGEQIKSYEATRQAKSARMAEIMETAAKAGTTLDQAQEEEYDTIEQEIASVDKHLVRLQKQDAANLAAAKAVNGDGIKKAADSRDPVTIVRGVKELPKGIRFAQVARCIGLSFIKRVSVVDVARELYADDGLIEKSAKVAGSSADGNWAANLVGEETSVFADFVEFLRPMTILGKFGQGGIPGLRNVPFRTPLIGQTSGGAAYWTGEGAGKGLTNFGYSRTTLDELKVANIAVVTEELLRKSSPAADALLRDQLAAALRERLDIDFIDPAKAVSAGISPASITNTAVAIPSSGNTADDVRADIKALVGAFIAATNTPSSGVWIMPATRALALSLMTNALGQPEFPGISMSGGTLFGMPVIVSEYVTTDSDGSLVILVNASDIYLGDEGGIQIDVSREASLKMDSAPAMSSTTPTEASVVSLWQTNSVAFRAERIINWAKRRAEAVQVLSGVNWGA